MKLLPKCSGNKLDIKVSIKRVFFRRRLLTNMVRGCYVNLQPIRNEINKCNYNELFLCVLGLKDGKR